MIQLLTYTEPNRRLELVVWIWLDRDVLVFIIEIFKRGSSKLIQEITADGLGEVNGVLTPVITELAVGMGIQEDQVDEFAMDCVDGVITAIKKKFDKSK